MSATTNAGHGRGRRTSGLPYRIGQSLEIVMTRRLRGGLTLDPHDCPAARNRESVRVFGAKVIRVRLDERRQRPKNRGRFDVGIRKGGDGR
jgi:hypothetical protein